MNTVKVQKRRLQFKPLTLTITLAVIFFVTASFVPIHAQPAPDYPGSKTTPPPEDATKEQLQNLCQRELTEFLDEELKTYRNFIETNFQNKSSTASLLDNALSRYRELRATAMSKYATYLPQAGASQLTEGLQPGACLALVEKNLKQARRLLETRARTSSAVKKTTALIDKYQQLNNQLRKLNQSFITMKAYLDTFAAKLPCYIKKSCNKG